MSDTTIHATWAGERRWDCGRPGGPTARLDGSAESGQSPVDALLSAVAACSGIDLVDILTKRRTPPTSVVVVVDADRRADAPRRVTAMRLRYLVSGDGIDRAQAERAVELAFAKYCSVASSLVPDIVVTTTVVLNGEDGETITHAIVNS